MAKRSMFVGMGGKAKPKVATAIARELKRRIDANWSNPLREPPVSEPCDSRQRHQADRSFT